MTGARGSLEAEQLRQKLAECAVLLSWNRKQRRERGFKHSNKQVRERAEECRARLDELARPEAKPGGPLVRPVICG